MAMGKARPRCFWRILSLIATSSIWDDVPHASHVSAGAQPLEGVLGLLVLGAAGALGDARALELGDDRVDVGRLARHRPGARPAAQRAVAPPVAREIELDHRDALALRVAPHIELGPMQQRMDAQVDAGREFRVEVVPELRRLVAEIPFRILGPRAEHPLLGPRPLLVAPDAGDDAGEAVLRHDLLQTLDLQGRAAGDA